MLQNFNRAMSALFWYSERWINFDRLMGCKGTGGINSRYLCRYCLFFSETLIFWIKYTVIHLRYLHNNFENQHVSFNGVYVMIFNYS